MSIFRQDRVILKLEKDPLHTIKKEIKKIARNLWILRQRKEFEWDNIESHFKLSNMEECQDALNKILYLHNRELISRKRRWQKAQVRRSMEKDWKFYLNILEGGE